MFSLPIEDYDDKQVIYFEKTKNKIIDNGYFIKFFYSTSQFTLNSIYIDIPLVDYSIKNIYDKNKIKCAFEKTNEKNKWVIERLKKIEEDIIELFFPNIKKPPSYNLYDKIKNGMFALYYSTNHKIYNTSFFQNNNLVLKISGLWITNENYGLAYKFLIVPNIFIHQ